MTSGEEFGRPCIYYWERTEKCASSELDFLQTVNGKIVPIEVKAEHGSTLRFLHTYIGERSDIKLGVRLSTREGE